jgi:hypothetical protein
MFYTEIGAMRSDVNGNGQRHQSFQGSALVLFVLYAQTRSGNSLIGAHSPAAMRDTGCWGVLMFALALTIRFSVMGWSLWLYLRFKGASQEQQ